jgi:hypothetical protein
MNPVSITAAISVPIPVAVAVAGGRHPFKK